MENALKSLIIDKELSEDEILDIIIDNSYNFEVITNLFTYQNLSRKVRDSVYGAIRSTNLIRELLKYQVLDDEEIYWILVEDGLCDLINTMLITQNLDSFMRNHLSKLADYILKETTFNRNLLHDLLVYQSPDPDSEIIRLLSSKYKLIDIEGMNYRNYWNHGKTNKEIMYLATNSIERAISFLRIPNLSNSVVTGYSCFPEEFIKLELEVENYVKDISGPITLSRITPKSKFTKISYIKNGKRFKLL